MELLAEGDPQRIGRYEVLGRIGAGGMGRVFLARSASDRLVAIKVIHEDLTRRPEFRARFARETEAVRAVGGFWTAAVVDAEAVAEDGPLTGGRLRVVTIGLCEALRAIHAASLVHRDLKPSNVLLAADGPRVIDFGIARAFDGPALTSGHHAIGTPGFMAPEQLTDGDATAASDIFCLGLTLAFAATGRAPFGTGGMVELSYRVVNHAPDLTGIAAPLAGVIEDCLAKDPAARPSAEQILDRITGDAERPLPAEPGASGADRTDPPDSSDIPETLASEVPLKQGPPTISAPAHIPVASVSNGPPVAATGAEPPGTGGRRRTAMMAISAVAAVAMVTAIRTWLAHSGGGSGHNATGGSGSSTTSHLVLAGSATTSTTPSGPSITSSSPTSDAIIVGSVVTPESALLAEIYAQALEAKGIKVQRKFNIDSRFEAYAELQSQKIAVVPEYNQQLLQFLGESNLDSSIDLSTADGVDKAITQELPSPLRVLNPSVVQDGDSLVVTADTARRYNLASISDLAPVADKLIIGGSADLLAMHKNIEGAEIIRGSTFKGSQQLDAAGPESVSALKSGTAQVVDLRTTDPAIAENGFVTLHDDTAWFQADNIIPLVNGPAVPQSGVDALNAVSAKLDATALSGLTEQTTVEKKDLAAVAKAWLASVGLL